MKTLQLDKKILTVRGQQAKEMIEDKLVPLTVREVLLSLLPVADKEGKQSVIAWDLAIQIRNYKKDEMEFSDEDFGFIRKVLEENFRGKGARGEMVHYYAPFVTTQIVYEMNNKMR